MTENANEFRFLLKEKLQSLIDLLVGDGYNVIGPTIEQEAIIYDQITSIKDLPRGWTDRQDAGSYRLERRNDGAYFGFVVGPQSWKKYLFPPQVTLSKSSKGDNGWEFQSRQPDGQRFAFLGVRACELAAMDIQDRVFLKGHFIDPVYQQRRDDAFLIAVNCTQAASTCFCTSMKTGPKCSAGFDLALTELPQGFVVQVGSDRGHVVLDQLETQAVSIDQLSEAEEAEKHAEQQITKSLQIDGIKDVLLGNLQHPHWDTVAERCLGCANCTMVCPTCFCSSVEEVSDLTGENSERRRHWDSCFNLNFSYMSHGTTRNSIKARYRQWLTHKLASWQDQFETSGCVGCGRCITWCPVEIDLTEEVASIREDVQ